MFSNRSSRVRGRSVAAYGTPVAMLLVVLAATSVSGRYFENQTIQIYQKRAVVAANVQQLRYYDTVLTDSARLAAATNEPAHERLYRVIVPRLDRLLKDTVALVGTPDARRKIAETSASNQALVAIELRSFRLARAGHSAEALALLNGPTYSREKHTYKATSGAAYGAFLAGSDGRTRRVQQNRLLTLLIAGLGAIVVVSIAGVQLRLRRRAERALERLAMRDPLTDIPNRRKLMADLKQTFEQASVADPRRLVMFDLDGFKTYNDAFGHPEGDLLLRRLAERFAAAIEGHGTAYRIGGDEFCALIPGPPRK